MHIIRRFFAFAFSSLVGLPIFFYFPGFNLYLEDSFVRRDAGAALLPICFVPLFVLIILSSREIFKYLFNSRRLPGLIAILIVASIVTLNGTPLLFVLQISSGLVLIYLWPAILCNFTYPCIMAGLFSASGFALLHLYDAGLLFYGQTPSLLDFYNYPFIFNYFIYHAYVGLPEVFLILSSSGILVYSLLFYASKKRASYLAVSLSAFLVLYSLSYGRASSLFAIFLSLSVYIFLGFISLIRSAKLYTRSINQLIVLGGGVFILLLALSSSVEFIGFAYDRFVLRAVEQGGGDRLSVWSQFYDSFFQGDLIGVLFGSGSIGSHSLVLDLLGRSGVIGAALFLFASVGALHVVFDSLRWQSQDVKYFHLFPGLILFFCSVLAGNTFNVSFTQPWNILSYMFFWSALFVCSRARERYIG
jgi:hypothetical protein